MTKTRIHQLFKVNLLESNHYFSSCSLKIELCLNNQPTPATTSDIQHHIYTDYKSLQHHHVYVPVQPQPPHLDIASEIVPFALYAVSRRGSNEVYQAFDGFHVNAMSFQLDTSAGLASS